LINYFKSYSSLGDGRFLCHPVASSFVVPRCILAASAGLCT